MAEFIAIVGAGLTGLMAAIMLAERKFKVMIFETRSKAEISSPAHYGKTGRSMSMDLSARAFHALNMAGVAQEIIAASVPMTHRVLHSRLNELLFLPYGQGEHENILTSSRTHIFNVLLKRCADFPKIEIYFNHEFVEADFKRRFLVVLDKDSKQYRNFHCDFVIGTDGVNSKLRESITAHNGDAFAIKYFPMSYKELSLLPSEDLEPFYLNAMHMWIREGMMLIAQPNIDRSFNCALLMPEKDARFCFADIANAKDARSLFDEHFPDASRRMPELEQEFFTNPTGKFKTVSGSAWSDGEFALIIGDAAHGMTPFFGQGVNCCFEDCTILSQCIDETRHWPSVVAQFSQSRIDEANAINRMSYENYPELFQHIDLKKAQLIREIEAMLSKDFCNRFRSYHNLVCFDRVPYTLAQRVKILQSELLERLSSNVDNVEDIDKNTLECELAHYERDLSSMSALKGRQ